MGRLKIKSIKYEGANYYYYNNKFKDGINILLGENGNGKSTFTYLIIYALGLKVDFFEINSNDVIEQIYRDTDKYVELVININDEEYILHRKIPSTYISIYNKKNNSYTTYNIARNGILYEKENITFSDWILNKLNIDIIEINQFSSTHKINFTDLFRLMYYDQKTPNSEIISCFGIKQNDFFRNSNIMKKSIFEVLISNYFNEYYKTYYSIKEYQRQKNEKKEEIKAFENLINGIMLETKIDILDNIHCSITKKREEMQKLQYVREKSIRINQEDSIEENNELNMDRINSLQEEIALLILKKNTLDMQLEDIQEELNKAQYVRKNLENDINYLDRILFTSKMYNVINEDSCPFCLEKITENKGKCICGSDKYLDYEKFIYSDKEYLSIMKSKIKGLKTTNDTISICEDEIRLYSKRSHELDNKIHFLLESIKQISEDIITGVNFTNINILTEKIMVLKEQLIELEVLESKLSEVDKIKKESIKIETILKQLKHRLEELEVEKSNNISENLNFFFNLYDLWLRNFYETKDINVSLDRDYKPVIKYYQEQSFNVPKRFFYYLALLNLSIEKNINFPRFLIIDTLKSEGIDVAKLKRLIPYLNEIDGSDFQVIMTCGYEEYSENLNWNILHRLSDDDKLLKIKK